VIRLPAAAEFGLRGAIDDGLRPDAVLVAWTANFAETRPELSSQVAESARKRPKTLT
jgi:hypothetical protein